MLTTNWNRDMRDGEGGAVWATGVELFTEGHEAHPHVHAQAQLVLTIRGLVICEVAKGLWMVPASTALWIPAGMEHSARSPNVVALNSLYVDPGMVPGLPRDCCTVTVSPLLRELIFEMSRLPRSDDREADERLVRVMLDELGRAPVERLHLPMPNDPRLRTIAKRLAANPSDRATTAEWAHRVGLSERTLFRLVPQETGMSFGRWRQQLQITFALERLSKGEAVQVVAFDLGYETSSAFITMFRKILGQSPARYLASRRTDGHHATQRINGITNG